MIKAARWSLRILNWLNWGLGVIIVIVGVWLGFFMPDHVQAGLESVGRVSANSFLHILRYVLPLTAPVIWFAHIIFTRLIAIIDSLPSGQVFSSANAERLRHVAWALLGTQVIDLIAGVQFWYLSETSGEYFGWSFSLTGWLAALLLFILARIFREGAVMREDLEGTV
jgi:hypothetical protein